MLTKHPGQIQEMFSGIAPSYDRLNHMLSLGRDRKWRIFTAKKIQYSADSMPQSSCFILDSCAGTCDLSIAILQKNPKAKIIAADFSIRMLKLAEKKLRKFRMRDKVLLVRADATRLPLKSSVCAASAAAFGIRNLASPVKGISEMCRAASPKGIIAILEFTSPKSKIMNRLYYTYLTRILPVAGNMISRSTAYQYLTDSVLAFNSGRELAGMLRSCGCSSTRIYDLDFDIVKLITGIKP